MLNRATETLLDYFGELDDPRIERNKRHLLLDIIAIAICAVISVVHGLVRQARKGGHPATRAGSIRVAELGDEGFSLLPRGGKLAV
jgi:hypothetical protein